ncbi:MAG: ATP-binding cassette domain-containing protein [SAR202 cluster bacterium]|nr:ATP-binding cassette domain-containing protein [SAR202 cluster bacterium]
MAETRTVEVKSLVKVYSGDVKAVNGIDFSVQNGEFFGLLGPNGAGKSTTMKIMATLLRKTSGTVTVAGYDIDKHPMEVRRSIGFAMQEVGLDDLSTGRDFLITQGLLYGLPKKTSQARAEELLELVGLIEAAKRKVGTYSGGMRRRLDLVSALMHSPPLVFLDEPTTGLDPQSRLAIWGYLEELNRQGTTVILTTQIMEEADRLCQRIAIIDRGVIVAQGTAKTLKAEVGGDVVTLAVGSEATEGDSAALMEKAKGLLAGRSYVTGVVPNGAELTVTVRNGNAVVPDIVRVLAESQVPIANLSVASPSLDDVFLKHTGHKIRSDSTGGDEMNQAMKGMMGLNQRR